MSKHFFGAVATLVGTVIGAGILGIPYVVAKSGFLTGLLMIIFLGIVMMCLNLITGEIALRTKKDHQITGYAKEYYGNKGKCMMTVLWVFCLYSSLIAYTIKEGEFLNILLNPIFGGSDLIYSVLFLIISSGVVFVGLNLMERSEIVMVFLFLIIISILGVFLIPDISIQNLKSFDPKKVFLPFGVILFAFYGMAAVPEMRIELKGNENTLKRSAIIGYMMTIIMYIIFAGLVVGVTGDGTTGGAIEGLYTFLGNNLFKLAIIFGILTMATSFLAVGIAIKEVFMFDYNIGKYPSSILTSVIPLIISIIIILSPLKNAFISVLDIAGSFGISLTGIFVILIFFKAKKFGKRKPEFSIDNKLLPYLLMLIFILGILYKIIELTGMIKI